MPQINSEDLDENIAEPLSSSNDDDESLIGNENVVQKTRMMITQKPKTTAIPTAKPVTIQQLKLY